MATSSIKNDLLETLDRLKDEDQQRVLNFARALVRNPVKGTPGRELLRFAGTISAADADQMNAVIEEACEQIDRDAW